MNDFVWNDLLDFLQFHGLVDTKQALQKELSTFEIFLFNIYRNKKRHRSMPC